MLWPVNTFTKIDLEKAPLAVVLMAAGGGLDCTIDDPARLAKGRIMAIDLLIARLQAMRAKLEAGGIDCEVKIDRPV